MEVDPVVEEPTTERERKEIVEECLVLVRTDRMGKVQLPAKAVAVTVSKQERIRHLVERFQRTLDAVAEPTNEIPQGGKENGKKRKRNEPTWGIVAKVFGEDAWMDEQAKVGVVFPGKGGECWAVRLPTVERNKDTQVHHAKAVEAPKMSTEEKQEQVGEEAKETKTRTTSKKAAKDEAIQKELLKMLEQGEHPNVPLLMARMKDLPFSSSTLRKKIAHFRETHKEEIAANKTTPNGTNEEAGTAPLPKSTQKGKNEKDKVVNKETTGNKAAEKATEKLVLEKEAEESDESSDTSTSKEESPAPPPKLVQKKNKDSESEETQKILGFIEKVEKEKGRATIKLVMEACDKAHSRAKIAKVLKEHHAKKQDAKREAGDKRGGTDANPPSKSKSDAETATPQKKRKAEESRLAKKGKENQEALGTDPPTKNAPKPKTPGSTGKKTAEPDESSDSTSSSSSSESGGSLPSSAGKKKEATEAAAHTSSSDTSSSDVSTSSYSSEDNHAKHKSNGAAGGGKGSDRSKSNSPSDREVDEMFRKQPEVLSKLLNTPEEPVDPKSRKRTRRK
uniref:Uncharacterized protein n=1 Tax=Picocystis salinarum TaxID=88271 RepID=A0A7S3XG73_9CHLO|mmetsp:Transcript_10541/g.64689  ORF Transcript_10541/g.64689 Transcript_10541/m.64689 type:complete len:563 (+) Transcript_10541:1395-3083(+)